MRPYSRRVRVLCLMAALTYAVGDHRASYDYVLDLWRTMPVPTVLH